MDRTERTHPYRVRAYNLRARHLGQRVRFAVSTDRTRDYPVAGVVTAITVDDDFAELGMVKVTVRDDCGVEYAWHVETHTYVTVEGPA